MPMAINPYSKSLQTTPNKGLGAIPIGIVPFHFKFTTIQSVVFEPDRHSESSAHRNPRLVMRDHRLVLQNPPLALTKSLGHLCRKAKQKDQRHS